MSSTRKATVGETAKQVYKHWIPVQLRYGDTDRQGHINNAVFCTLYESGRCAILFDETDSIAGSDNAFVIAKLTLDFLEELNYPGVAQVGTRILSIGRTSFTVGQAIFKDERCCSTAESVVVLIDAVTHKPAPLIDAVLGRLQQLR